MKSISHSIGETEKIAKKFIDGLIPGKTATVVGLSGNLGSGKTTFVQAIAKILGVTESITSPTFVLMKFYEIQNDNYKKLVHIDAYRLEHGKELEKLRVKEVFSDPKNLVFIEWPENVKSVLPKNIRTMKFEFVDEKTRAIQIVD